MSGALATVRERHVAVANQLELARPRLEALSVGTGLLPSRSIAVVLDALTRNPALLECSARSIVRSVAHAAELGLEIGDPLGSSYLVPFYDSKKRCKEASMMIGYRGFVALIRRAPKVDIVKAVLVHQKDVFEVDEGENRIVHKRAAGTLRERGEVVYAYARVWYANGSSQFDVMDRDELDKIKADALKSKTGFSPWQSHEGEMQKKCPIRRMAKVLELGSARRGAELDDLEAMRRGDMGSVLREGFESGRATELKSMLAARDAPVRVIDADFDEGGK